MGTNEKFLNSQFGNKRPFKVPDGYFERLTSQIVDNLPEKSLDGSAMLPKVLSIRFIRQ